MRLLIPLGLLGLLGLIALIIIYILKPNYQQKMVSSTFVWKLSLKYKKKRIPISRLRNILILICQILVICSAALILAQPAIVKDNALTYEEAIYIIDGAANMRAETDGTTRFDRAVEMVRADAEEVFSRGGRVTVILAGHSAEYIVQRLEQNESQLLDVAIKEGMECSYGVADIDGAMALAEETLIYNPEAEVVFFTGTQYSNPGKNVTVEYVSAEGEWNAAILDASASLEDGYYEFTVQVACYGAEDREIELKCEIRGVNGSSGEISLPPAMVETYGNETITVHYSLSGGVNGYNTVSVPLEESYKIYSFEEMFVHIDEKDSLSLDNEYYVYGVTRPTLKVQYYTTTPNPFYSSILMAVSAELKDWNIEVKEIRKDSGQEPALEGYDFYLFEGEQPDKLPTDGVVFMADPDKSLGAGFTLGSPVTVPNWSGDGASLAPGIEHDIMNYVDINSLKLTQYTPVSESSLDNYDVLAYYQGNPVFFVRNEENSKIAVVTFSVKNSNFNIDFNYVLLMANVFTYFFPRTFDSSVYGCYDTVDFTPRGTELTVLHEDREMLASGETSLTLPTNGTYLVRQTLISGAKLDEKFYVTIPDSESNIAKIEPLLTNPYREDFERFDIDDLLVYFAGAMVALLFLERLLSTLREG